MEPDHEQKRQKKPKRKHRHDEDADPTAVEKMEIDDAPASTKKDKKKHKHSKHQGKIEEVEAEDGGDAAAELGNVEPTVQSPEKKHKRHKSETKKEKKHSKKSSKHERSSLSPSPSPPPSAQPTTNNNHTAVVPDDKQYPFFTQTFSQRIPVWPAAFDEPLTKTAHEYLDPMLNRYSPKFKGVLLAYKNVNLSHRPQRASAENPPTNDTPVMLESFECYAPPFAWLTADLHLFVPSRGAWMEGEINLQSEGHIGVVCFEKFNASISRKSLPRGWQFVEQEEGDDYLSGDAESFQQQQSEGEGGEQNVDGEEGAEGEDAEAAEAKSQSTPRLRSTGYWVDENGDKVGGKIYFRIKNFSSGSTGDYTYLSLQGTMLDDEAERKIAAEEREAEKARRARSNPNGLLYPTMRLPESSMTKLKDVAV